MMGGLAGLSAIGIQGAQKLQQFLQVFVTLTFLPEITTDVNKRIDRLLQDDAAFTPKACNRVHKYTFGNTAPLFLFGDIG